MKTAAAYIRVSTEEQTELSPDSQLKQLREYAKAHDMILPDEFVFQDDGISGRTTVKRPAFNKMIGTAKLKPKPFDVILLWKFSRFARNREDSIVYKSMLRKQLGIEVISISESIGDDKMSILIEAMIEAMDEYYSLNLSEEVKRGMTEKVNRGLPVTVAPFGYDLKDKQFYPNPVNAPLVESIFSSYAAGASVTAIVRKMNALGSRTTRGNLWEVRTIKYILNNPVYIGKIRWNPNGITGQNYNDENIMIVDGHHQPIISQELWKAVQDRIDYDKSIYRKRAKTNTQKDAWALRSMLKCSACGGTITRATKDAVQCYRYSHGQCEHSHYSTIRKLEHLLADILHKIANGEISPLFAEGNSVKEAPEDSVQPLILAEERKLKRVKTAYEAGIDTLDEYRENKEKILKTIEELKRRKSQTKKKVIDLKKIEELAKLLENPKVPDEEKNLALRSSISYIVFNRNGSSTGLSVFF